MIFYFPDLREGKENEGKRFTGWVKGEYELKRVMRIFVSPVASRREQRVDGNKERVDAVSHGKSTWISRKFQTGKA